jgi:hypothetical protein
MFPNTTNLLNPNIVPSYARVATPASLSRQQSSQSLHPQQFQNTTTRGALRQTWYAAQDTTKKAYKQAKKIVQNLTGKARDYFKLFKPYWNPRYVVLFTQNDEHTFLNGKKLNIWLNSEKRLNLDPTRPGNPAYDTILEAIKNGTIILDWDALVEIWQGKMLNINNKHVKKYITGLGYANPTSYKGTGTREEFGRPTWNLTDTGEKMKNLFALQFLGFAVHSLLNTQPENIIKKEYQLHRYLHELIFRSSQNTNELMYTLKYRRKFQFAVMQNNVLEEHEIEFCCIFNIFRIKTSATTSETRINLASVYPSGEDEEIAFKLWEDHDTKVVPEQTDIEKFDIMKQALEDYSIFDSIRKIHPNLDNDQSLQTKFTRVLRVPSLIYREVMKWPSIQWPVLQ